MKNEIEKIYTKSDIFDRWYFNKIQNMTFQEYQNSSFVIVGIQVDDKNYFLDPDEKIPQLLSRNGIKETDNYLYLWKFKKGDDAK